MRASPEEGGLGVEAPADADVRAYLFGLNGPLLASSEGEGSVVPVDYDAEDTGVYLPLWHRRLQALER